MLSCVCMIVRTGSSAGGCIMIAAIAASGTTAATGSSAVELGSDCCASEGSLAVDGSCCWTWLPDGVLS